MVAPLAVKIVEAPLGMVTALGLMVTLGTGLTVTVTSWLLLPQGVVVSTRYVVVVAGTTVRDAVLERRVPKSALLYQAYVAPVMLEPAVSVVEAPAQMAAEVGLTENVGAATVRATVAVGLPQVVLAVTV